MYSSIPLLEFNNQGDIHLIERYQYGSMHSYCFVVRYILHQISLIVLILIFLVIGGLFFSYTESNYYLKSENERKAIISETYEHIRTMAMDLLNEELNENFEAAYRQWRWQSEQSINYILLNDERARLLDNLIELELKNLTLRLDKRQIYVDKHFYKWTYSTSILYAATLVTTIGYGNISPKTTVGKIATVIYALFGILFVVSWLKLVRESLAISVIRNYQLFRRYLRRCLFGRQRSVQNNLDHNEKVPFWISIALLSIYLAIGSALFAAWEGWSYLDGAYFSFITFTTIGFGDFVPGEHTISHRSGRSIACAVYLLFGIVLTALGIRLIQEDVDRIKTRCLRRLGIEHVNLPVIN